MVEVQTNPLREWQTSSEYQSAAPELSQSKFLEVTDLLLERPNLNSTHLFRADILYDDAARLRTVAERELSYEFGYGSREASTSKTNPTSFDGETLSKQVIPYVKGYTLQRTVIRRLIPRKPQVDQPLDQSCFVFVEQGESQGHSSVLVIYAPHATNEAQIPWYHPRIRYLAYHYQKAQHDATLSLHYKLFSHETTSPNDRLHRTFISLLNTFMRLSKLDVDKDIQTSTDASSVIQRSTAPAALKDTILPQHIVQDTYTRLKQTYAADLISRWVEKTEPSKHVFEDLSIAAFLIELWKTMYSEHAFPGFVDIACGNGVLVYVLIKEGFQGCGFDARRRKTWEVLGIDDHLEEKLYIPRPFLDVLNLEEVTERLPDTGVHSGSFEPGTFVISNHADELTLWTPLLAASSCGDQSLPFLAIPCCSHALSGNKHRYSIKDIDVSSNDHHPTTNPKKPAAGGKDKPQDEEQHQQQQQQQPVTGDLRALRKAQVKAATHNDEKSTYACLTKKTVAVAAELGFETEMTLMRIPSTRNIGIVGNRHLGRPRSSISSSSSSSNGRDAQHATATNTNANTDTMKQQLSRIVERECMISGGVPAAARIWIDRALKLVGGQGRGKVNLGGSHPQ